MNPLVCALVLGLQDSGPPEDFAFRLHREFARAEPKGNLFHSPPGIWTAFAMLSAGAEGTAKGELLRFLGAETKPEAVLHAGSEAWLASLVSTDPKVHLEVANAAWFYRKSGVLPAFRDLVVKRYRAAVEEFDNPGMATDRLDAWISERTEGLLKNVAPRPVPEALRFYLANVVYFKAAWSSPFVKDRTADDDFIHEDGRRERRPFMRAETTLLFLESERFRMARLPYGEKGRFGMIVAVPSGTETLAGFSEALNAASWKEWTSRLAPRHLALSMPRFKADTRLNLLDLLKPMGVKAVFEPAGRPLQRLSPENGLFVDAAVHQTALEVDEAGTRAAAATILRGSITSVPPTPVPFKVDRPFFCAIVDEKQRILFMGLIRRPD
jgi:serpin B